MAVAPPRPMMNGEQQPFFNEVCDCMQDCGLCLDTCFCFPCVVARTCSAVNNFVPNNPNWLTCCCTSIGMYIGFWSTVIACACCLRTKVRKNFNIAGSCMNDCICAFCCPACVVCQTARQAKYEGIDPGNCCCTHAPVVPKVVAALPGAAVQPGYSQEQQPQPAQ
eukprot:TRINITY_DN2368_c0_g2_i1.p3 TRINITY_DN2368_c0_g2~~TRINITY_DN2368_c0_g2_i1.p3  ORF type:complete len:165 (+),score=33.86 TRINITY_DN2368_c0_g2_i1:61-555(+)